MKKRMTLIAMLMVAGIATADILEDADFTGTGFGAINDRAIELEAFANTAGWTAYSTAFIYDTVNDEVDRDGDTSRRAIGQCFRIADIRAWSPSDELVLHWTALNLSDDDLQIQVFATSNTTWGGRPRLQDMALPTDAVELASTTITNIATLGGTLTAPISDWAGYTYLIVRVGVSDWDGAKVSFQSVDIIDNGSGGPSAPVLTLIAAGGASDIINWTTEPGYTYSILYSTSLSDGFLPLQTGLPDTVQSWTNTIDATQVFYKVEVQ